MLSSLDNRPIRRAGQLLLVTTARSGNSGMAWKDDGKTLDKWGSGPTVIEPVTGAIVLQNLKDVRDLHVVALSPTGRRLEKSVTVLHDDVTWRIELGTPAATWYLIDVQRN